MAVAQAQALFRTGANATEIPRPVRSGMYGITWNFMVVNGLLRTLGGQNTGFTQSEVFGTR